MLISRLGHGARPRRAMVTGWGLTEVLVVVGILILLLAIVCSVYLQAVKHAKQKANGFTVPESQSRVAPDEMHCSAGWRGAPRHQPRAPAAIHSCPPGSATPRLPDIAEDNGSVRLWLVPLLGWGDL